MDILKRPQSIDAGRDAIGARAARHLDIAFRGCTVGHGAEVKPNYFRWITGEAHPLGNFVVVSGDQDEDTIGDAVRALVARNVPAAVLFPQGGPASAARALAQFGFEDQGAMPAMAVDIDRMATTMLPPDYLWTRVGAGGAGRAWADAMSVGYSIPPGLALRFSPEVLGADMAPDARMQFFGIERNGRIVATSLLYLADGLAGIYCVATVPDERRKGLAAHVTAQALRVAQGLGYGVGVLQSSSAGHPVYVGLGFEDLGSVPMFVRMPR